MGTGFTIDTPLKVARFGISSVVSLVDDGLLEQMRRHVSEQQALPYEPIEADDEDARARRTTAYLDLLNDLVRDQVDKLREEPFGPDAEIGKYFEMLPPSPPKSLYFEMLAAADGPTRDGLQARLRRAILPGAIDVNIMTKVDRDRYRDGEPLAPRFSDALSSLRGFVRSGLRSSVVLSAGMNRRLFSHMAEFSDFYPDERGELRKRITLKVSDYRSALVQGKLLARLGLWVSEYRVESGLNCGGHAFGGRGRLLGPILDEFRRERERFIEGLREVRQRALAALGRSAGADAEPVRITVQGGIGTAEEDRMLREQYGVDGTGWASPFLLVPEAVNIDAAHLRRLAAAGEEDIVLSEASPLGVPFWILRDSESEIGRREAVARGRPGSSCPKGFLASNTEFTRVPICTASRAYQRRKLRQIAASDLQEAKTDDLRRGVEAKACLCRDLAGSVTVPCGIEPATRTAVCCGPNLAYFSRVATLREMTDHIYGRARLPVQENRPHVFLKELALHLDRLRAEFERRRQGVSAAAESASDETQENLRLGLAHYRALAARMVGQRRTAFVARLEALAAELERLAPVPSIAP